MIQLLDPPTFEVFIEREYQTDDGDIYVVQFSKPYKEDDWSYACRWKIAGPGYSDTRRSVGVDGLSAFFSALYVVRAILECTPPMEGRVKWLGESDLGLLTIDYTKE